MGTNECWYSTLYIGSKGVGYTWEPSSRIGKGIHKAVEQRQGDFRHIGRGRRCGKSLRSEPQVPPHQRNGVAESGFALGILVPSPLDDDTFDSYCS